MTQFPDGEEMPRRCGFEASRFANARSVNRAQPAQLRACSDTEYLEAVFSVSPNSLGWACLVSVPAKLIIMLLPEVPPWT